MPPPRPITIFHPSFLTIFPQNAGYSRRSQLDFTYFGAFLNVISAALVHWVKPPALISTIKGNKKNVT
jgi:hypothetical protein